MKPCFEQLESRQCPTTITFDGGALRIIGSPIADRIAVRQADDVVRVSGSASGSFQDVTSIFIDAGDGSDLVDVRRVRISIIEIHGGAGNDRILGAPQAKAFGGLGDDFYDDDSRRMQGHWEGGGEYDCNADKWTDGYWYGDIRQGGRGTCSWNSAVSKWIAIGGRPRITYLGSLNYTVQVGMLSGRVVFGGFVYVDAYSPVKEEFYPALIERLWMQQGYPWGAAWPDEAWREITGRSSEVIYGYPGAGDLAQWSRSKSPALFVAFGTKDVGWIDPSLNASHAYFKIRDEYFKGISGLLLRDPWGTDGGRVKWGDPDDGIIWISYARLATSINYRSAG